MTSNDLTHYAYVIYRTGGPIGVPVWVGGGKGKRASNSKLERAKALGVSVKELVAVKIEGLTRDQAYMLEKALIAAIGRQCSGGPLLNKAIGGRVNAGAIRSSKTRARISEASRRRSADPAYRGRLRAAARVRCDAVPAGEMAARMAALSLASLAALRARRQVTVLNRGLARGSETLQ